jgi:hypothetical protein
VRCEKVEVGVGVGVGVGGGVGIEVGVEVEVEVEVEVGGAVKDVLTRDATVSYRYAVAGGGRRSEIQEHYYFILCGSFGDGVRVTLKPMK